MIAHLGSLRKFDSIDSYRSHILSQNQHFKSSSFTSSPTLDSATINRYSKTLYAVFVSIPSSDFRSHDDVNDDECNIENYDSITHPSQEFHVPFSQEQYDFMSRLFCILDTENRGSLDWKTLFDFLILRCPIFRKRDLTSSYPLMTPFHENIQPCSGSLTFDEIWNLTIQCSRNTVSTNQAQNINIQLGLEGWMIFSRFILVAQLLEIKRSFSCRHLQQTMQHKKEGKSSEVVLVQVPPPDPPSPLDYQALMEFEWYDLPEMELDFSFKDYYRDILPIRPESLQGVVEISDFRSSSHPNTRRVSSSNKVDSRDSDFVISFYPHSTKYSSSNKGLVSKVKRSLKDLIWLHETFVSHKVPGDILWGRIIPPFPIDLDCLRDDDRLSSPSLTHFTTDAAISVAKTGAGVFSSLTKSAKSLLGEYVYKSNKGPSSSSSLRHSLLSTSTKNPNSWRDESCLPTAFERYLNYVLECPVLSLSFVVHAMLKVKTIVSLVLF